MRRTITNDHRAPKLPFERSKHCRKKEWAVVGDDKVKLRTGIPELRLACFDEKLTKGHDAPLRLILG